MKVLKELILNGVYILGEPNDPTYVKYELQYDGDNHGFKILIFSKQNNRSELATNMAVIIEQETGNQLIRNEQLVLNKSTLKINHHGVNALLQHNELKKTIELLQLIYTLQRSTSTLDKIQKELIAFLNNDFPNAYFTVTNDFFQYQYTLSDKYHKTYRKQLIQVYCERLTDLIKAKFPIQLNDTTGIITTEDPPAIIISPVAMQLLRKIFSPQDPPSAQQTGLQNSSSGSAPTTDQASRFTDTAHATLSSPAAPSPASRTAPPPTTLEQIAKQPDAEIDIDLELFFRTGEHYFKIDSCEYIASYDYDPSTQHLTIVVNKEMNTSIRNDNLTPRTAYCQRIAEHIYNKIKTKYDRTTGTDIVLTKAERKIDLSKQAVAAIISDNNSPQSSTLIKLIDILHKPDTIECKKLLLAITSNQNKLFHCDPIGNSYHFTSDFGNTTFKPNPGISVKMSLNLVTRVQQIINNLFMDKYPALYNNLDTHSIIWKKNPAGHTIKFNKKACDDVLCDTYLQIAQVNIPPQENISCNEAKELLNSLTAPLKERYLNTATITRMKEKLKNTVTSLAAKMNNLDDLCQFYEFLKSEPIIKLLNAHKNPIYDSIFSKTNTNTWQEIIKEIRSHAFTLLRNKTEPLSEPSDKAELILRYRNHPIFTDHRYNKFINRLHSTHTAREIDNLIASYRSPAIAVN